MAAVIHESWGNTLNHKGIILLVVDTVKLSSAKPNLTQDFYMDFIFFKYFLLTKKAILNQLLMNIGNISNFFIAIWCIIKFKFACFFF